MIKKLLSALLALLICLLMLPACQSNGGEGEEMPPEQPIPMLQIIADDLSIYQIVIASDAADFEEAAAYELRFAIKMLTGVELPVVEDSEAALDTEIVIGADTARKTLYQAPVDCAFGYAVFVADQRIVVEAETKGVMKKAIRQLMLDCTGVDISTDAMYTEDDRNAIFIAQNYQYVNAYVGISDAFYTELDIVYDGSYMQKRMAYCLQEDIHYVTRNKTITVQTEATGNRFTIELCKSAETDRGRWRIEISDTDRMTVYANDYYGFTAASKFVKKALQSEDASPLTVGAHLEGNHVELLEKAEMSSAYAYNKTAEYRVMFNNVLWESPVPAERNLVTAEMVAQYMPDVLGCQEFNRSKREGAGENDLTVLLANLGYVESIDPRVENANKWGSNGSQLVYVGNKFFRTFYNCTPLFYNQNTTICIDSGYYWYENQIDNENQNNCSAMDCASKAMTWGVFESKETGERYIVISTHMCTRSNGIRGKQAQEAVEVINELTKTYNYPVIFGGDINGTATAENYRYFVSEDGGLENVLGSKLPSLYCSGIKTHHNYPEVNSTSGLVDHSKADMAGVGGSIYDNIDHIFVGNTKEHPIDVTVFGVVYDECSVAGSDHLPIYVDFSIP